MLPGTPRYPLIKNILTVAISLVWLINGLFCKLLNFVPRHRMIVSIILGNDHAVLVTRTIGVLETLMFAWILSSIKSRWCALTQVFIIATMNIIEFIYVPELLLFGRANIIVAAIFISIIFFNEFIIGNVSHNNNL